MKEKNKKLSEAMKGNQNALGNNGGRPPKFETSKQLERMVTEYINDCPDTRPVTVGFKVVDVPCPTISGMAMYLGFVSRQSMYDYENNPKFSYIIKKARIFIESEYEKKLHSNSCTGAIFALKNMGWEDKQKTEHSGGIVWNETKSYGNTDEKAD